MREITVPVTGQHYPIVIGEGALDELGDRARAAGIDGTVALIQDAEAGRRYGARARQSLEAAGFAVTSIDVPSGEQSKSLGELGRLYEALSAAGLDRRSAIVALGGGVVGDLAGFAAATYLRGIAFVQAPTTLLAQVDASVGGKTAIDLAAGKNLAGAFHQPRLVLIDPATLATLPEAEYRAGLAEVLKYGVIADAGFFEYQEAHTEAILGRQPEPLAHLIGRSCEIKAEVVGEDERESGRRAILNFGHTVGHAVEALGGYIHGEAVAIGMVAATALSQRLVGLPRRDAERIHTLIAAYGLPTRLRVPLPADALLNTMRVDKKTLGGELRFVLARRIGTVEVAPVDEPTARAALQSIEPAAPTTNEGAAVPRHA
ncbi:MAG TPA: 3-dehydroquinate synthase [Armatimonadota bacterium]|nr:3-dehydroquinate synthase [Armatimonadota bacterium]